MTKVYTVWHLNLSYSSLEYSQHQEVIDKCYSPILELLENGPYKFGIEASASTLERINELDPEWIHRLKRLIGEKKAELVGSGYAQIIGPLVPAKLNQMNIRIGNDAYSKILGAIPSIFLLNEQVFSPGLLDVYAGEGVSAIIMEWENPYSYNIAWDRKLRLKPQLGKGIQYSMPIIWNHSVAFQKLQRMAHGDITINEWTEWFSKEIYDTSDYALCIYGGDAETFDFRAKRYLTESANQKGEWERIKVAFDEIINMGISFVLPKEVLEASSFVDGKEISLSNAKIPLPTKKQTKYNPLRWAVGGRDAFLANATCEKILKILDSNQKESTYSNWKRLLELWGSDFRTHITELRWKEWKLESTNFLRTLELSSKSNESYLDDPNVAKHLNSFEILETEGFLTVRSNFLECILNTKRGLAIESCSFAQIGADSLFGTIHHGDLHHIDWNADFYSGEFVVDLPGLHKVTDLEKVVPEILLNEDCVVISASIETRLGPIVKTLTFSNFRNPSLTLAYKLNWSIIPPCTMRFGDVILNSKSFETESLFVETHNGGFDPDHFLIGNTEIDHGKYWSPLISARNCFGATEGMIKIGDKTKALIIRFNKSESALPVLLTNANVMDDQFTRLQFTARELDDTSANQSISLDDKGRTFEFSIEAVRL